MATFYTVNISGTSREGLWVRAPRPTKQGMRRTARKYGAEPSPADRRLGWLLAVAGAAGAAGLLLVLWRVVAALAEGQPLLCWQAC